MSEQNTTPHPFLTALKEQSYKTAWHMIKYRMDMDDVYTPWEILDHKSIMGYLIDGLASFNTYIMSDDEKEQKHCLENIVNYYESLKFDYNAHVESAKNSIIQNYKNIDLGVAKKNKDYFSRRIDLDQEKIVDIFDFYSKDILNAIQIDESDDEHFKHYIENGDKQQPIDLASWMAFNVKNLGLLRITLEKMEQSGFDFNNTQYDIESIILKNDLEKPDFYNSNLLTPKKSNQLNKKSNFNNKIIENDNNLEKIIKLMGHYKTGWDHRILPFEQYQSHFNAFLMDWYCYDFLNPNHPNQDSNSTHNDSNNKLSDDKKARIMNFIHSRNANQADLCLKLLDKSTIDQVDQTNQSLLYYVARINDLMKLERLSRKKPDWFKGNEYGFPFYEIMSQKLNQSNARKENYQDKIISRIRQHNTPDEILDGTIRGLQTMQQFHANHLLTTDIDVREELNKINHLKTNVANMMDNLIQDREQTNEQQNQQNNQLNVCIQTAHELEDTLILKYWSQKMNHLNTVIPHLSFKEQANQYKVSDVIDKGYEDSYIKRTNKEGSIKKDIALIAANLKTINDILPDSIKQLNTGLIVDIVYQSFAGPNSSFQFTSSEQDKMNKKSINIPENIDVNHILNHNKKILSTLKNNPQALTPDCKNSMENVLLKEKNKHTIQEKRKNKPKML